MCLRNLVNILIKKCFKAIDQRFDWWCTYRVSWRWWSIFQIFSDFALLLCQIVIQFFAQPDTVFAWWHFTRNNFLLSLRLILLLQSNDSQQQIKWQFCQKKSSLDFKSDYLQDETNFNWMGCFGLYFFGVSISKRLCNSHAMQWIYLFQM